jgi:hypothetical protein
MFVVCDETAEQAKRTRAEKGGKMKELLEQYNRIQAMAIGLRHVNQDIPGLVSDDAVEVMINKIGLRMNTLAHDIISELQQEIDAAAKQPNEPEQLGKPLWAVIAAGEPDYEARSRGIMGSTKYRMYFSKEDALESIGDSIDKKIVPVWGE